MRGSDQVACRHVFKLYGLTIAKNVGRLIHGDGCFAGQGVVYETLPIRRMPWVDISMHFVLGFDKDKERTHRENSAKDVSWKDS